MSDNGSGAAQQRQHPFAVLTPDFLLDAVEAQGYRCDGRLLPLNSYENRVYQVGMEVGAPLIAKFYRPYRWSDAQILEEHQFCFDLVEQELPVVAPLQSPDGASLLHYQEFRFALFPRQGGRAPEFDNLDNLLILGRFLGRIHLLGASKVFSHRPALTIRRYGEDSVGLISRGFIPGELKAAYDSLTKDLLQALEEIFGACRGVRSIRVHGDCHAGNILWRDDNPHFVDLDDTCSAPAIQDIWMLLSGDRERQTRQLASIMAGYTEFYDFHPIELRLIEALRTLRIMHYSAWLAKRWNDPAFPLNFPWFNTVRYWSEHILELREQYAALQEPVLELL